MERNRETYSAGIGLCDRVHIGVVQFNAWHVDGGGLDAGCTLVPEDRQREARIVCSFF